MLEALEEVAGRFPEEPKIQLELAQGMFNAANTYGKAERWEQLEEALEALEEVAGRFPVAPDIQYLAGLGLLRSVNYAQQAEQAQLQNTACERLKRISERWPQDEAFEEFHHVMEEYCS